MFPLINDDYSCVQLVYDQYELRYRYDGSAQKFEVARMGFRKGSFAAHLSLHRYVSATVSTAF